jgi:2-polyprenyl-6-methoxyphenol hydroxylase-like FAD-dependent oxidoreductase
LDGRFWNVTSTPLKSRSGPEHWCIETWPAVVTQARRLIEWFARDRGPAAELIAGGELQLATDNTHHLPNVPRWHRASMAIIGDAAHAPSPSSGQGASMAIEDGVVLAQCLKEVRGIDAAFTTFERCAVKR